MVLRRGRRFVRYTIQTTPFTCSLCSKNMTKAAALGAFNVIIIAQQTNQAEDDASV